MADLEAKIKELLNSPDGLNQILNIARSLTGGSTETQSEPAPQTVPTATPDPPTPATAEPTSATSSPSISPEETPASETPEGLPDLSALSTMLSSLGGTSNGSNNIISALGSIDPKMIQTAMAVMTEYRNTDDRRLHVLDALRPYFKDKDANHIDKAIQITRLSKVIKRAFSSNPGGDLHV